MTRNRHPFLWVSAADFRVMFAFIYFCHAKSIFQLNSKSESSLWICLYTQRNQLWFLSNQAQSDCIYHFPIEFVSNGISFGWKSVGKWYLQSDFGWFSNNPKSISLRACPVGKKYNERLNFQSGKKKKKIQSGLFHFKKTSSKTFGFAILVNRHKPIVFFLRLNIKRKISPF